MVVPVGERRPLARAAGQLAGQQVAERLAGDVVIGRTALDEIHRYVERPVDIGLESKALVEDEGNEAGAFIVRVAPDLGAVRQQAIGAVVEEG